MEGEETGMKMGKGGWREGGRGRMERRGEEWKKEEEEEEETVGWRGK